MLGDDRMKKIQYVIHLRDVCKKYFGVIAIILAYCIQVHRFIMLYQRIDNVIFETHVGDYLLCFFYGTMPYTMLGKGEPFNIPPYWSFYLLYVIFFFSILYSSFFSKYEQQKMIRYRNRTRWWIAKNRIILKECISYFLISGLTFLGFGVCTGSKVTGLNIELLTTYFGMELQNTEGKMFSVGLVFILSLTTIIYIQLVVTVCTNAIVGVLVSIAGLIASVYHMHPFLIGNFLMIIRLNMMEIDGVSISRAIILCLMIVIAMMLVGYNRVKKMDLF